MACFVVDTSHSPGRLRRGMCRKHHERFLRHGDPRITKTPNLGLPLAERFWTHVIKGEGCWLWRGAFNPETGYGHWSVRQDGRFVTKGAHRWAYILTHGSIDDALVPDHTCETRLCVRPDHLEAVTQRENTLRSATAPAAINARKTECIRGHKLTSDNVYVPPKRPNSRYCKRCQAERGRARSAR
jgi:hypothetical protein